jgi:Zn-dependent protease
MLKSLLLLLKGGKLGAVLLTCGTMLISVVFYASKFGWPYAAGLVGLIFVHEMGHFLAARQRGLKVGAPTFIPFIGAWVDLKDKPHDAETEAYIALAGPVTGTLGALGCYYAGRVYDERLFLALAYAGFMINLFNLIPLPPLDGGRVTGVLSPKLWRLGLPLLVGLYLWQPNPLLLMVGLLAWPQLMRAWRHEPDGAVDVNTISAEHRLFYAVFYLALVGFLALMSYEVGGSLGYVHWSGHGFALPAAQGDDP